MLQEKDTSLWEAVKNWAKDVAGKIRAIVDAYKDQRMDSREGRIIANMKEILPQLEELYAEGLADTRVEAATDSDADTKKAAQDGGVKYSIRETDDGRSVAVVDDDILSHIGTTSWDADKIKTAKAAARNALEQFSDGIAVNGITRKVNRASKKEFTRSNYTEKLANHDTDTFADKMRMADVTDDIVTVATGWRKDGKLVHPRKDNFVDFDHGYALIMAGKNQYNAEIVVGITDIGEYVFYDVTNITPDSFKLKEEPLTTATTEKPIGDIQRDSSGERVSQDGGKVKQKLSDRDPDAVKVNQILQKQNAELRETVGYLKELVRLQGKVTDGTVYFDIAEIALSALGRQYIANNRISDLPSLRSLLEPWAVARNFAQKGVDWHFTTDDARTKLKHLYPIIKI